MAGNQIILFKQMLAVYLSEYSCRSVALSLNSNEMVYVRHTLLKKKMRLR